MKTLDMPINRLYILTQSSVNVRQNNEILRIDEKNYPDTAAEKNEPN